MDLTETIKMNPIQAEKSVRTNQIRALTSCQPGKIVPLAYAPVLREDRVSRGRVRVSVDMSETVETLMNAVNVTAYAHFVPFLALQQFKGMDDFNRSYQGIEETEGEGDVKNFFQRIGYSRDYEFFSTMGIHAPSGTNVNASPLQAYNEIVNFRRKARSTKLPLRAHKDHTLAEGFWKNPGLQYIVPDFDQAMIDGEVALNIAATNLPVKGIGFNGTTNSASVTVKETGGDTRTFNGIATNNADKIYVEEAGSTDAPAIFAELADQGIKLSLSNIELAKKTAAFAAMRQKYSGLDDEHLIDLLMEGIRVPEEAMKQPMLLDRKSTIVGYTKRNATDAANLDKSVTTGRTQLEMNMRLPAMNTGGIIMITLEIVPEQLFERMEDTFLTALEPEDLPNFTRDYLDPEKVDVVKNRYVDVWHGDPDATFGYAPLNHDWNRNIPNIGGKFFRRAGTDPFNEDRQRIWAVEPTDPTLTEDFYLVKDLHTNVFADTEADPFEVVTIGNIELVGNTVFGKGLSEDTGDYDKLMDIADTDRINQEEIT